MRKPPEPKSRPAWSPPKTPRSKPRMGRAATDAKLTDERALILSRHGVSRETVDRLDRYVVLLRTWQAKINLVSPSTVPEIWTRHIEDGLILAEIAREPVRWVDLGSGAGLPGLVLAIVLAGRAGAHVDLVESNAKKAAFLRAAVLALDIPAAIHAARIEDCGPVLGRAEAVSARALAPLAELFALVAPHLAPEAACWFLKGRAHEEEIAQAAAHWRFDMVKHSSDIEDGSVVLEIRGLQALAGT